MAHRSSRAAGETQTLMHVEARESSSAVRLIVCCAFSAAACGRPTRRKLGQVAMELTLPPQEYKALKEDPQWVEHFVENLLLVPKSGQSVFYSSMDVPPSTDKECATINSWRWHEHGRFMLSGMWLLRGSAQQLGLPKLLQTPELQVEVYSKMYMSGPPGKAISLPKINLTITDVQRHLKATGAFVCEFPLHHPRKWETVPNDFFWPGVIGNAYPRHVHFTCPALTVRKGEQITTVSFYDPPDSDMIDVDGSGLMTGQHGMLEAYQFNGVC